MHDRNHNGQSFRAHYQRDAGVSVTASQSFPIHADAGAGPMAQYRHRHAGTVAVERPMNQCRARCPSLEQFRRVDPGTGGAARPMVILTHRICSSSNIHRGCFVVVLTYKTVKNTRLLKCAALTRPTRCRGSISKRSGCGTTGCMRPEEESEGNHRFTA